MVREDGRFEVVREGWYQETKNIRTMKGNSHYEAARIFEKAN